MNIFVMLMLNYLRVVLNKQDCDAMSDDKKCIRALCPHAETPVWFESSYNFHREFSECELDSVVVVQRPQDRDWAALHDVVVDLVLKSVAVVPPVALVVVARKPKTCLMPIFNCKSIELGEYFTTKMRTFRNTYHTNV